MQERCEASLLLDMPADSDAFGSHERIANHPLAIESNYNSDEAENHAT